MILIQPRRFAIADLVEAVRTGWRHYRAMPGASIAYAAIFAVIGLVLMTGVGVLGLSPLVLPLAGGFMLVGPALLAGFFALNQVQASGGRPRMADALSGFIGAPSGLWAIAGICAFLFLIWITDVGVLYAFMIGAEHLPYELPWLFRLQQEVVAFEFWASIMGSVLAFAIFSISAFSVPLLHERRAGPIEAISISVRAVFGNLIPALLWGMMLSLATMLAILLLPLLLVVLPVLAYASFALYQRVLPLDSQVAVRSTPPTGGSIISPEVTNMKLSQRLAIAAVVSAVCLAPLASADEPVLVVVKKYKFEPAELTVQVGQTVRWENQDKRQYHSVFFKELGDKPGDYFFPGESRERTFDTVGTFDYICEPHWESHGMKGTVIVE